MTDAWAEAYNKLVTALEVAREAGVEEGEAESALVDVYHEEDE